MISTSHIEYPMCFSFRMSNAECSMSLSDHQTSDIGQRTTDIKKETI